jgi:3-oxoacyl-[acyl-carrier protein] reductase
MKILINGASTGIGAETARELAAENEIYVHYHSSSDPAKAVVAEVERCGGTAIPMRADLRTDEGCRALFAEVQEVTDTLDVLINNGGIHMR